MWCQLCLAINANISPIGDMELKLFIEKMFKQYGLKKNIEVHDFACWGCKALLKKSYNFFQRVFTAQQELLNIMQTHKTVNLQLLKSIHRQELSLDINLSYKKTPVDYFINKDIKIDSIDNNIQFEKPSTSYEFDVHVKTVKNDEVFEQNIIDSVDKTSVEYVENIDVMGSISKIKNNVWSDTKKVISDEDECYTDEVFEQNMIDNVDKPSVEHLENIDFMGSISKIKNNVWSDTKKLISDEDECYTDEVFEQNMIDSVDKPSVEHVENKDVTGSVSKINNNVLSDTEKVVSDEDECYLLSPRVATPSEHSSDTYSVDPFNELARTTENKNVVETNNSVPEDFDPKKVNLLTDIEFTKMKKRRNVNLSRLDYKCLLPSSSDTENSGDDRKKTKKNKSRRKSEDSDFVPEEAPAVTTSESSEDSFDDEGKRIKRPKDRRVYPMQCENCEAEIPERKMHYRHYLIHHPDIEYPYIAEKKYLCQYCGRGYTQSSFRNQHEQTHSGKRAFQCPICPKKFLSSLQMVKHKYNVHGAAQFICDYCGRNTKTRGALLFHIRSHTGEKPYNCHICNAAFSHHAYRISHIKHAHGQNGIQTKLSKPKTLKQGKAKSEETKRGRKKGTAKKDDSEKKEKSITKKRYKKKGDTKKRDAMKKTQVIPTEKKNIKEITTKKRMDSVSSEDEILASILKSVK